ncbi:MAG: polyphosphate kinase 1 [Agriterribacter sp.]
MNKFIFFNRDASWLSFNERVLLEAEKETTPLLERIRFMSIFSSNLDEFYRVRMPAVLALQQIKKQEAGKSTYEDLVEIINQQQALYGNILNNQIVPALKAQGYIFLNKENIPSSLQTIAEEYFFTQIAGYLHPVKLSAKTGFFPENNQLYLVVVVEYYPDEEQLFLVNVPSSHTSRFVKITQPEGEYIVFLEDIIRSNLAHLFSGAVIKAAYSIKITRDAELNLADEYEEDLAEQIETQLHKRDMGFATRFLYEPGIPLRHLQYIIQAFHLQKASVVEGSRHHNLKDLSSIPIQDDQLCYPSWKPVNNNLTGVSTLFEAIKKRDQVVHTPYQSYDRVVRFFNEAVIDSSVQEIYTTLYRVASHSKIVHALISAAKTGKKVTVLVELKARFDEANNIYWAKQMKAAGVKIVYSDNALKVHAKIALVKRDDAEAPYLGLLATGNLNETTARFYTDHILLTAYQPMLKEMETLFSFLSKKKKPDMDDRLSFNHLLVAQFNLQSAFIALIDREISNVSKGLPASITIKLNNLEEEKLISKLYEASNAGVKIHLIVRSICRLVPGVEGQSTNITIKRIVDRYLEHGRVFIFHNNGDEAVYMGSADWMNRNIYRRIEVCFPVYDEAVRQQVKHIIQLQWSDNVQAVYFDKQLSNVPVKENVAAIRSQEVIYHYLQSEQPLLQKEKIVYDVSVS